MQVQAELGDLTSQDLGLVMLGSAQEVILRVKANHHARRGPARSTGALRGRCARDAHDFNAWKSGPRRVLRDAVEPAINYSPHAFNGDRTLCDVSGQDDLALAGGLNASILLFGSQVAVERRQQQVLARGEACQCALRATDLERSRQEHEYVAFGLRLQQALDGFQN